MKSVGSMLAAALVAGLAQVAVAGDCCDRCGCQCACRRVTCKIVCDIKKEKYHIYACECEDFCLPGPSHEVSQCPGCGASPCACGQGESGCGCVSKQCHEPGCIWKPSWCHLYHRKKLVKYECEREVPVYKCVVVELCPGCCAEAGSCCDGHGAEGMEAPAPNGKAAKEDEAPMPPKLPSAQRGRMDILKSRSR